MKKIYIDSNIISNILQEHISEDDFYTIGNLCEKDDITFVTSKKTREEYSNTKDQKKRVTLNLIYKIMNKIPYENLTVEIPATYGGVAYGEAYFGGVAIREDNLFTKLSRIFPDKADAIHIFQAIKSDCNYFLTLDRRSILTPAKHNKESLSKLAPNLTFTNIRDLRTFIDL